jgi:hypothetical protein
MDIVKIRHQYQITISRRALLILLSLMSFFLGSGIVLAVAPILREAIVLTYTNSSAVHDAIKQSEALRADVETIRKGVGL